MSQHENKISWQKAINCDRHFILIFKLKMGGKFSKKSEMPENEEVEPNSQSESSESSIDSIQAVPDEDELPIQPEIEPQNELAFLFHLMAMIHEVVNENVELFDENNNLIEQEADQAEEEEEQEQEGEQLLPNQLIEEDSYPMHLNPFEN